MQISDIIRPQGGPKRDFDLMLEHVKNLHKKLMAMTPVTRDRLGDCDFAGVYLFSDGDRPMYVGRSHHLRERIFQHSRPSNPKSSLALFMAAKYLGLPPVGQSGDSWNDRLGQAKFKATYDEAKKEISKMLIRYVGERDGTIQALLEIYTSTKLNTLNEFKTSYRHSPAEMLGGSWA